MIPTILQTIWHFVAATPLAQIALLVTLLVGFLSILKDVWKIAVGAYQNLRSLAHWYRDRKILCFIKAKHPQSFYEVSEIATALQKSRRHVSQSLHRLQEKKKVRRLDVNELHDGLWGLHELEE